MVIALTLLIMEFPLIGLTESNSSKTAAVDQGVSLYSLKPVAAALYVGVLGVAAVVGTFGNLVVVMMVLIKHLHNQRFGAETTDNDAGRVFTANLALSDLIVTAVINPLAIAGLSAEQYSRLLLSNVNVCRHVDI